MQREAETGCDNVHLDEKKLYDMMEQLCREKDQDPELQKDMLLKKTLSLLRDTFKGNDTGTRKEGLESSLSKLSRQKEFLLNKLLDGTISDTDYKMKNLELTTKFGKLNEELKNLEDSFLQNRKLEERIGSIRERLEGGIIERAKTADMLGSIKTIKVFPDHLEFYPASWEVMGTSA